MNKEEIVLDESFLNTCMGCSGHMESKGVYDFYCSKKCEKEDQERILKGIKEGKHPIEILSESLRGRDTKEAKKNG